MQHTPGKQSGLSLIELMIASVIGLLVLAGAVTIFSSNSSSSSTTTGMARLQDNGTVALDILSNSIRMAGYEGCRDTSKEAVIVLASTAPTVNFPDSAVWGSNLSDAGVWAPAAHGDLGNITGNNAAGAALVRPGTDVLYLQHGSGRATNLGQNMTTATGAVILPTNPDQLGAGDLIMISNCQTADIFRATAVTTTTGTTQTTVAHGATGNSQANLTSIYEGTGTMQSVPVRVMRFESNAYFVGPSGRTTSSNAPIFSLFAYDTTTTDANNTATELVEGVENMQVLYGMRTQSGGINYVTANNVTNWGEVDSIQIGLLIATTENSASLNDSKTYNIAGSVIGPTGTANINGTHAGDRRLRAAFNTTIQLRNRIQ